MTLSNQERSRRTKQLIGVWLRRVGEPFIIIVLAIPALQLAYDSFWGPFLADPFPPATRISGIWGMRLLVAGLAITPLARMTGLAAIIRFRRPVGLWAAAYSIGHFAIWSLDYGFDLSLITTEILRLRYLFVGFIATVMLVPLAATSFNAAIRWVGGRNWRRLHWLVYPSVLLALWHMATAGRLSGVDFTIMSVVTGLALLWRVARALPKLSTAR
ncbi:MAG: protein-methionine-sulfoxide reductase heme-binding subunit MsrQ [Rhodospirillales bacterium]|jgi:sulfoxide reductase heme-binding subunit YedZ|nr:protein-methionine-sulfoxide reductase heme-binding subunit MsrQ [Rhodospirillales bacterium]